MPHPYCVTFLYQSSSNYSNPNCSSNNSQTKSDALINANKKGRPTKATNRKLSSTGPGTADEDVTYDDDDDDSQLLSLLMRNGTTHSMVLERNELSYNCMMDQTYNYSRICDNNFYIFKMGMIIDEEMNIGNNGVIDKDGSTTSTTGSMLLQHLTDRIDTIRRTLPLDSKRPTVNRRFYYDQEEEEEVVVDDENGRRNNTSIVHDIEHIVCQILNNASCSQDEIRDDITAAYITCCAVDTATTTTTNSIEDAGVVEWFVYCNRYLRILEYDVVDVDNEKNKKK